MKSIAMILSPAAADEIKSGRWDATMCRANAALRKARVGLPLCDVMSMALEKMLAKK